MKQLNDRAPIINDIDELINFYRTDKAILKRQPDFKNWQGDKLHKEILDDLFKKDNIEFQLKYQKACFVAGTLVHTDKGLVPIQDIKVGDMVLSCPENGGGEPTYKRVTNTFITENQPIWGVLVGSELDEGSIVEDLIFCTRNHPFYSLDNYKDTEYKWKEVKNLEQGLQLHSKLFENVYVSENIPLYKTLDDNKVFYMVYPSTDEGIFISIKEYTNNTFVVPDYIMGKDDMSQPNWDENEDPIADEYLATVYNIEVEDYHTYYVGKMGVWVHNCDPSTIRPTLTNNDFTNQGDNWLTTGDIRFDSRTQSATLSETANTQTSLRQAFALSADNRLLSFTIADKDIKTNANQAGDAFEAALLDAHTGQAINKIDGLTRTDSLLNIQADGTERLATGITKVANGDGTSTYYIDLTQWYAAQTATGKATDVMLSFDLLGFGNPDSRVTIKDINLTRNPVAVNDSYTFDEDTSLTGNLVSNDILTISTVQQVNLQTQPAYGRVTIDANGNFSCKINPHYLQY